MNISSGGPWEAQAGYSRAVRIGSLVWVAGTTAMTGDGLVGEGDPYQQARQAIEIIRGALAEAGARLEDVVRTRMYVVDPTHVPAVIRAHGEAFGTIRPAATLIQVAALIDPRLLVEIEAEACLSHGGHPCPTQ